MDRTLFLLGQFYVAPKNWLRVASRFFRLSAGNDRLFDKIKIRPTNGREIGGVMLASVRTQQKRPAI